MNDLQRKDSSMKEQWNESTATAKGLYDPSFEHDNCGIGAVVNIKGIKTHQTVENALSDRAAWNQAGRRERLWRRNVFLPTG